jgi:hypothetical protein
MEQNEYNRTNTSLNTLQEAYISAVHGKGKWAELWEDD